MATRRKRTKAITSAMRKKSKKKLAFTDKDLLHTGCTTLNLAISNKAHGGFVKGHYFWMAGDSSSGKTFLLLTCLAEACANKEFDDYRLIYDNVEDGALMDMDHFFGSKMADRVEPPAGTKDDPEYSTGVEDFYFNLDDAFKKKKKFIYILDSMDALVTEYQENKFQELKKATRSNKKAPGNYGDGKAKINSERLRAVNSALSKTGSILIILSQTRDNINAGMFEDKSTTSGGRSLKFYATAQLHSRVGSRIRKVVNSKKVSIGVNCRVAVKKNRLTGRDRTVIFPIYYESGIDDIGGMVDWMVEWKLWPKNKTGIIQAGDFKKNLNREKLIQFIEDEDMRADLEMMIEEAWNELERKLVVKRKSKYE